MRLITLGFLVLSSMGCITFTPEEWAPREHRSMQRACRSACYPEPMGSYEAMTGRCTCGGENQ